jgi:hypothetical protein
MDAISPRFPLLRFAALLHDLGKVDAKIFIPTKGDFAFFGHERVSEEHTRKLCARFNFSNRDTKYLCSVVRHHMHGIDEHTSAGAVRRFMANNPNYRDTLRLRIADRKGNLVKAGQPAVTWFTKLFIKAIRSIEKERSLPRLGSLAVNGYSLIRLGLRPSPMFKDVLNYLLDLTIDTPEMNTATTLQREAILYVVGRSYDLRESDVPELDSSDRSARGICF